MEKSFHTLAELRAEILTLKGTKIEQEVAIKAKFSSPGAIFSTAVSLFKGNGDKKSALSDFAQTDIVTTITRLVLPTILNTLVFRKSNFITKAIITFLSQKAAKKVDTELVVSLTEKVKSLFSGAKSTKPRKRDNRDYGIPPDSETY